MQMPRVMRRINRDFTNRVMGPIAAYAPPMAVVHHVGRKSGRPYRTPVLAFSLERGILTPLPYGTDTDWVLNLLAAGGGELEVFGSRQEVENPRVIDAEAALELVPGILGPLLRLLGLPGFVLLDRGEPDGDGPAPR
jgi:deazaflavin-dependent oxidoreductase (nitroreductase family)